MIGIKQFVFRWAATTIAVMVASSIIRGIRYDTVAALIGASLLLGILNAFVRPFLLILSAPVILITLGLFILVLNGLLLLSGAEYRCRISCGQLLERVLGRDCDQLRQLGFKRIFPRERRTRACDNPSQRDTPRPRSSP
jgi:uncharacterized membrane protein YvlD (DUF360 family)